MQKTAEEVAKTDVGQAVKKVSSLHTGGGRHGEFSSCTQGSEVVKEDLIDDLVKESDPYKAPETPMKRSDLASDFTKPETKTYEPNE